MRLFEADPERTLLRSALALAALAVAPAPLLARGPAYDPQSERGEVHHGEPLDPSLYGPGVVETMEVAIERERLRLLREASEPRNDEPMPGVWATPTQRSVSLPHSGRMHVANKGGALAMGIAFPTPVDLQGVWVGGPPSAGSRPSALRAVGYRDGLEVGATDWMADVEQEPRWLAIALEGIDRVVFEAQPAAGNRAFYTLDDLTYSFRVAGVAGLPARTKTVVLDFEDCSWRQQLTGSGYAGLVWESGIASQAGGGIHAPLSPPGSETDDAFAPSPPAGGFTGGAGTLPDLLSDFEGIRRGEHSSSTYPPDTCGAIGPDHYVEVINRVFAVYNKTTGAKLVGMNLGSFLPGSNGDPRVHFDASSNRWIVTVTDFDDRIYIAVSLTTNPAGSWFKSNFVVSTGSDTGCWPDYPTMGVDQNGIYVAAYMVGCDSMSLWAVNKAPLVAATPSLGTVTAFRNLSYEGAIQPCLTHGSAPGEYVVSTTGTQSIRVRRCDPPLTNPSLVTIDTIAVGTHQSPPEAPALGSTTGLSPIDDRLMNAVYRDGSIWCGHTVNQGGKAACRWYEIETAPLGVAQSGTVTDAVLHFLFPALDVNADGDVAMGFSGTHSGQYAGAYYTGRKASDPQGEMAVPVQFRAGQAPQNNIDSFGRNRWGDYSLTNVDPEDDRTFWTIQEYAHSTDVWGTHVAEVAFDDPCPTPANYCSTSPNSVGSGALIAYGGSTSVTAENFTLFAYACAPSQPGIFYYGAGQTQVPFGNGFRCVSAGGVGTFRLPAQQIDAFGDVERMLDWNQLPVCCGLGAIDPGEEWNFQFWYRDPAAGGANFNFSDGLNVTFCP